MKAAATDVLTETPKLAAVSRAWCESCSVRLTAAPATVR